VSADAENAIGQRHDFLFLPAQRQKRDVVLVHGADDEYGLLAIPLIAIQARELGRYVPT
jgi:hypothetical protein